MADVPLHSEPVAAVEKASAAASAPRRVGNLRLADWLALAAAPTFLAMTVATAFDDGAPMICSGGQGTFPLTGMAMMYLLMSAFHLAPWLRMVLQARAPG